PAPAPSNRHRGPAHDRSAARRHRRWAWSWDAGAAEGKRRERIHASLSSLSHRSRRHQTSRMKSLMPSSFKRILVPLRRGVRRSTFAQVLALVAIWAACEALVRALDVNFPAGVLGMLLLLAALFLRWLQLPAMRRGAEWL